MDLLILDLNRIEFYEKTTIGELYIDDVFFCYTLEDAVRGKGIKIAGKTAIGTGVYPIKLSLSNRFGRVLPILSGVPNFTGIRMHRGNSHEDTEGCIITASKRFGKELIWDSTEEELITILTDRAAIIRITNNPVMV